LFVFAWKIEAGEESPFGLRGYSLTGGGILVVGLCSTQTCGVCTMAGGGRTMIGGPYTMTFAGKTVIFFQKQAKLRDGWMARWVLPNSGMHTRLMIAISCAWNASVGFHKNLNLRADG